MAGFIDSVGSYLLRDIINPDEFESYINAVINMAADRYYGGIEKEKLMDGALKAILKLNPNLCNAFDTDALTVAILTGIFKSLGRYCDFFPHILNKEWVIDKAGIRVKLSCCNPEGSRCNPEDLSCNSEVSCCNPQDFIGVCYVYPSSPAHKAGILPGDKIIGINGKNLDGESIHNIYKTFTVNSTCVLRIIRPGVKDDIFKEISYREKKEENLRYAILSNAGYIRINSFGSSMYESLCEVLNYFDDNGVKNIILDLRNNSGGSLRNAVHAAQLFVPAGIIARLVSKSSVYKGKEFRSDLQSVKYRIAVLVNSGTASSSEILAGALQDSRSGTLIGTNTYGKADVMKEFEILSFEAYIKARDMTGSSIADAGELKDAYGFYPTFDGIIGKAYINVARYVTPSGKLIDGTGLKPDIWAADPEYAKQGELDATISQSIGSLSGLAAGDEQLLKALEFFA